VPLERTLTSLTDLMAGIPADGQVPVYRPAQGWRPEGVVAGGVSPFLVAAADAPQAWKDAAAYRCLGSASTAPRKDATTIMQAIADLPAAGGLIVLSPGTFVVLGTGTAADGAVNVNKSNVTIAGQGMGITTILLDAAQGTTSLTGILRTDSTVPLVNVTFRDLSVDGNRTACTGRVVGVYCGRVNEATDFHENVTFARLECRNVFAYALDPHERTKNLWVVDCWSHHNGGHLNGGDGLTVDWVQGFVVRGGLFHDNTRHGINLVTGADDGRVESCRCHHNGVQGIAIQKATTGTARDITVLDCDVSANADVGIYLNNCYRNRLIGNTVYANAADGIRLAGAWDNAIAGNTVYDNNTANGSGRAQIRLSYDTVDALASTRNTVTGNVCRNDGLSGALTRGIYNQNDCNENVIAANVVSNHAAAEIEVGTTGTDTVLVANNLTGAGPVVPPVPGALVLPFPRWIPGRYYGTRSQFAFGTLSGQALIANQAIATPFYAPDAYALVEIAASVTTPVAGAKLRLAVYAANATDGRPGTLLVQTGDLSGAATGKVFGAIAATLLPQAWYWAAILSDQAISVNGYNTGQPSLVGSDGPESNTRSSGFRGTVGAGWSAFPPSFPSPSETATTPLVEVKI
jgi:parallel beta-helix repeat protein